MSVFVLSPDEFGAIAATLRISRDSFRRPIFPLSIWERWEYEAFVKPDKEQSEEQYTLSRIDPFVYRLYLANAMAERYTYMNGDMTEFVIPLFDLSAGRTLPLPELLKTLETLAYNIVTNGGNTFLGVKDDEKLRRLVGNVKTQLIGDDDEA